MIGSESMLVAVFPDPQLQHRLTVACAVDRVTCSSITQREEGSGNMSHFSIEMECAIANIS